MTNEAKFKAIVERLKPEGWCTEPTFISVMMIANYLDQLSEHGVVECAYNMTENGQKVAAICEEFDWKPTDEDILRFVTEMVEDSDKAAFAYILKQYRDNKDNFIKEIKTNSGE